MSKSICTTIRRELEEMTLSEDCDGEVARHLSDCAECRDFHQKQTRLRQIVGSLGTVSAPPDFDLRLRSRLANENSNSSFHLTSRFLTFGQRSVAAATALALLVAAIVLVRHLANRSSVAPSVVEKVNTGNVPPVAPPNHQSDGTKLVAKEGNSATASNINSSTGKRIVGSGLRPKRQMAVLEQSSEGAKVVGGTKPSETIFPIDASQQSLRVSLFDGRGNPRTISLPPVSFGSQRVVPTTTAFAPKGVW
ncbi:MAG TPA: hypothetical protein VGQ39_17340 [Pyrinomonadaceae bacterium]|nr:hypothetical protein [Pyrinomonadaceae bacterium]